MEPDFELAEDRYSRQRLIASWSQERLAQARIIVAGAGALGNEVLKNLALAGVGNILTIDFDRIEISNLSRSVLFRETDVGCPKASTAANALRKLNPEISIRAIDGDIETDLGLGIIREYDLVLGCLDSIHARWILNRACWKAGRPWIDAGINATVGEVSLYVPDNGPCYECGMTEQMWRQIHKRRSCMLLPNRLPPRVVPTTTVIASLTAALQVNEALAWVNKCPSNQSRVNQSWANPTTSHGAKQLALGETLFISLAPYSVSTFTTSEKPDCLAHETYKPSIFVEASPSEMTVKELLDYLPGGASLQLDFDVLSAWQCVNCGEEQEGKRLSAVESTEAMCPICGAERTAELVHEISYRDRLAEHSLEAIGVPPRSILRIKTDTGIRCLELTKEV